MDIRGRKETVMKNKKMSLTKRIELAQRREMDAKRRMMDKDREMRRSNAIADGSMVWVTALATKIGPVVHLSKEEFTEGKKLKYVVRRNEDGSMDMCLEGHEDEV